MLLLSKESWSVNNTCTYVKEHCYNNNKIKQRGSDPNNPLSFYVPYQKQHINYEINYAIFSLITLFDKLYSVFVDFKFWIFCNLPLKQSSQFIISQSFFIVTSCLKFCQNLQEKSQTMFWSISLFGKLILIYESMKREIKTSTIPDMAATTKTRISFL